MCPVRGIRAGGSSWRRSGPSAPIARPSDRAPPWSVRCRSLLITGPANAAKAGAVLDRLRAALPARPAAGRADGGRRRALPARARRLRARLRRGGADVPQPRARDRAARPALRRAAARAASRATASCAPRSPTCRCGRSPRSAATPGFAAPPARCSPSCSARSSRPRASPSALRAWAEPARAAYADELAALYAAYRRRLEALGRPDREGYAWAALDALRADPAAWGGAARVLLRLRRPHADRARRGRDARAPREADVCVALPVRARPRRVRRAARRRSRSCARSPPRSLHLPERSEHYAPARAARAAPPRALAVRAGRRARRAQRRGPAARGGRRARRGRARRRRGARADAPGHRAARHRRAAARRRGDRRAVRPGARRLRDPGQPRPPRRARRARGSAPACSPRARAALPGRHAPPTC